MKIFEIIQRHHATLGIYPSQQSAQQQIPLCRRIIFGFLLFGYIIVSEFLNNFHATNDFMECVEYICSSSSTMAMFLSFVGIVHRQSTIFKSIDTIETIIDASKDKQLKFEFIHKLKFDYFSRMQMFEIEAIIFENQSTSRTIE